MVSSNDHCPAPSSRATWTDELGIKQLLTHFNRLIQSPQSVQRLRRFILDLAVRGKLVPQDPNDEPASELLERIAKKKKCLEKEGTIRKQRTIPSLTQQDFPFPLPTNWKWGQIAEIGLLSPRNEAADDLPASFIPMPMIPATYGATCRHEVRQWGDIKKGYTHFVEGDVGLAKITPCFQNGKSVVFRNLTGGMGSGTTELHVIRPIYVDPDFIALFLKCPHFIETGIPKMTGTAGQKRVPTEYFAHSPFPLPPLPEQRRIVSKVDELMALCDRLEAAQTERETRRTHLAATSLARLNTPDQDQATFREHVAFTLENIAPLTTRPDQIKNLRQTILNLAVRGKLVPQNPNDEPASELLKRIAKEKARLVKAGESRVTVTLEDVTEDEEIFVIPEGWCWTRLGNIVTYMQRGKSPKYATGTGLSVISQKCVRWNGLDLSVAKEIEATSLENYEAYRFLRDEDLLWNSTGTGTIGRVVRVVRPPAKLVCDSHVTLVRCPHVVQEYIRTWLRSDHVYGVIEDRAAGSTKQVELTTGLAQNWLVPLPPLPEQHRIVTKVDQLMEVCDQLEAAQAERETTRERLFSALLYETLERSRD